MVPSICNAWIWNNTNRNAHFSDKKQEQSGDWILRIRGLTDMRVCGNTRTSTNDKNSLRMLVMGHEVGKLYRWGEDLRNLDWMWQDDKAFLTRPIWTQLLKLHGSFYTSSWRSSNIWSNHVVTTVSPDFPYVYRFATALDEICTLFKFTYSE